jgi:hypothetical protein
MKMTLKSFYDSLAIHYFNLFLGEEGYYSKELFFYRTFLRRAGDKETKLKQKTTL